MNPPSLSFAALLSVFEHLSDQDADRLLSLLERKRKRNRLIHPQTLGEYKERLQHVMEQNRPVSMLDWEIQVTNVEYYGKSELALRVELTVEDACIELYWYGDVANINYCTRPRYHDAVGALFICKAMQEIYESTLRRFAQGE